MKRGLIILAAVSLFSCDRMIEQERVETFERQPMLSPPGTIARGHLREDTAFHTGIIGGTGDNIRAYEVVQTEAPRGQGMLPRAMTDDIRYVEEIPVPITMEFLWRGQERFSIYCAPCHGRTGDGDGMIVQRGFPPPPSFHIERLRNDPPGRTVNIITHGYGMMYSYRTRVAPEDRWAIAAYIKALQLSRTATIADVADDGMRNFLESQP